MEETVTQLLISVLGTHNKINQSGTIASSLLQSDSLAGACQNAFAEHGHH